jgi:hypothetical protein
MNQSLDDLMRIIDAPPAGWAIPDSKRPALRAAAKRARADFERLEKHVAWQRAQNKLLVDSLRAELADLDPAEIAGSVHGDGRG